MRFEDDFRVEQPPDNQGHFIDGAYSYQHDRDSSLALVESTNTPWNFIKTGTHFDYSSVFIGFLWDLTDRRVSLPTDKRLKFLQRVQHLLQCYTSKTPISLHDVQKIHGSLVHISFIYILGCTSLSSLSNFMCSYNGSDYSLRFIPGNVIRALKWWETQLLDPLAYRQLRPLPPLEDRGIFVDASTSWGIGIIMGPAWCAFKLVDNWKVKGRDITWLEAVALELLFYFLIQDKVHDAHLLCHSDNNGAIGAHVKGRSANDAINACVGRSYAISFPNNIVPSFRYIPSADNPADPISRGEPGPSHFRRLPLSFKLPHDLLPFFHLDQ